MYDTTTVRGFTRMSNKVLRDKTLSENASGLMLKILSLRKEWRYTIKGLAALCADGTTCIRSSLNELEIRKYLIRNQTVDSKGRFSHNEYIVAPDIYDEGFTPIENHVVRDKSLTLKALGIFAKMKSLPNWKYTTAGLKKVCRCGITAIRSALRVLEEAGHIIRNRTRTQGRLGGTVYTFVHTLQLPQSNESKGKSAIQGVTPDGEKTTAENLTAENLTAENLTAENLTAENLTTVSYNNIKNIKIKNTRIKMLSILFRKKEAKGKEFTQEQVRNQLEFEYLKQKYAAHPEQMLELVELVTETLCAKRKTTRIAGADFPHEIIQQRFSKLTASHIEFVLENLNKNTSQIRNIKQYLLTCLFNSVTTIDNAVAAQVNHDMREW